MSELQTLVRGQIRQPLRAFKSARYALFRSDMSEPGFPHSRAGWNDPRRTVDWLRFHTGGADQGKFTAAAAVAGA